MVTVGEHHPALLLPWTLSRCRYTPLVLCFYWMCAHLMIAHSAGAGVCVAGPVVPALAHLQRLCAAVLPDGALHRPWPRHGWWAALVAQSSSPLGMHAPRDNCDKQSVSRSMLASRVLQAAGEPASPRAFAGDALMGLLRKAGAAAPAAALCREISSQYPEAAWAHIQLGLLLLEQGNGAGAVSALQARPADAFRPADAAAKRAECIQCIQ